MAKTIKPADEATTTTTTDTPNVEILGIDADSWELKITSDLHKELLRYEQRNVLAQQCYAHAKKIAENYVELVVSLLSEDKFESIEFVLATDFFIVRVAQSKNPTTMWKQLAETAFELYKKTEK